jgi:hypothetical protein
LRIFSDKVFSLQKECVNESESAHLNFLFLSLFLHPLMLQMKKSILISLSVIAISVLFAFTNTLKENNNSVVEMAIKKSPSADETWYICVGCCKTKKATTAPWENGCKKASSGTHNYWACGKAGDYNYTCRNCDAEVYLTSSSSPSASTCCGANKGTHSWYHR